MLKQNIETLFKEQKKNRPKIEDISGVLLEGDRLKNLLDFVVYLQENKMSPAWASVNSWKASYKGKGVCYIKIPYDSVDSTNPDSGKNTWYIQPIGYYGDECDIIITNDAFKEIVWSCVKQCNACNGRYTGKKRPCNFGTDRTISGKEFERVCGYINIKNPNGDVLNFAKMWTEAKKQTI